MIFAKNFARNYENKNTWNIRRMVEESFVPAIYIVDCRILTPNWTTIPYKSRQHQQREFDPRPNMITIKEMNEPVHFQAAFSDELCVHHWHAASTGSSTFIST